MTRTARHAFARMRARWSQATDRGAAMILVLAWGLLMSGLVVVVAQAVVNQIAPSDRSEKSYAALSAAEAGLADIEARLQVGSITMLLADENNAALTGWVPVPGGSATSEFTYAIDASRSGAVGEIRAFAMGRDGDVTRSLEAVLSKRSTLDYVYMSDIETPSPDLPGAYSTTANSGGTGRTAQELARLLCSRRWYEPGPVSVNSSGVVSDGNQRNYKFCQWAGIYYTERLVGRLHSNDVWRLEGRDLTAAIGAGMITSSCRTTTEGLTSSEVGCPTTRRYILTSVGGGATSWNSSSTAYQGDAWRPASGTDATLRNPLYDAVLDLPPSPALLKQRASETGCIYTGPTRIRFYESGGVGYMNVTSPDTKVTAPGCDGGDGTTLQSPATNQVTRTVNLSNFTDLVIYVQNVRRSTEADDTTNDYDLTNQWVSGSEPTCTLKGTKKFPFVIPNDATDKGYFTSGSTYKGFPSEQANPDSPWYGSSCASGDLYVQGSYKGAVMLATENNVVLTSSLKDSNLLIPGAVAGDTDYGKPNPASQSVLGLAAGKFAYAYRPTKADNDWVGDWLPVNAKNPIYDFALLAIEHCFGAQDHGFSGNESNGNIYLWGSLAQKYRCAVGVGTSSGYQKKYSYDDRLTQRTPPYMLELSNEPWGNGRTGELTPDSQPIDVPVSYGLLRADDIAVGGSVVSTSPYAPRLTSVPVAGQTTMTYAGSQVTLTSHSPGLVVVTYEVLLPTGKDLRRLVVQVE